MKETFCYYLGAGASCNSLPVSANFPEKIDEFVINYKTFREDITKQKPRNKDVFSSFAKAEEHFYGSLGWLAEESRHHTSVDTLAKKLYLKHDFPNLNRLKITLSTYLLLAQTMSGTDYRYDAFLATILRNNDMRQTVIPDNIHFVTWNYDMQIERAYYEYTDDKNIIFDRITLRVDRINGLAGSSTYGKSWTQFIQSALGSFDIDAILTMLERYWHIVETPNVVVNDIQFAWENDIDIFKRNIKPKFKDTTILVDIGYSFPYFNRDIDKIILNCMPKLRKIYLQVLQQEHEAVKTRMSTVLGREIEIVPISDDKRFFIPYEL